MRDVTVGDFISDHCLVTCALSTCSPGWPTARILVRALKSIDTDSFTADIRDLALLSSPADSLDGLVQQYNDGLRSVLDKHAPLRPKTVVLRPTVPWWNNEIREAKKRVRKAERVWRKKGLTVLYETYINLLVDFSTLLRRVKINYYREKIAELNGDSRSLHKLIDGSLYSLTRPVLPSVSDSKRLAADFSNYYSSKVSKIRTALDVASGVQPGPESSSTPTSCHRSNFRHSASVLSTPAARRRRILAWRAAEGAPSAPSARRLFTPSSGGSLLSDFVSLTPDDVVRLVKSSTSSTCQLDPIPTSLLKKYVAPLATSIANIINRSLSTGSVPSAMKHALVKPLLKKPNLDKEDLSNYRPVSNTPFLSKLIERAVAWQLLEQADDFLPERQSAYRPNYSTETSLLCLFDDLLRSADDGNATAILFLDMSAAFDTVDHDVLLERLSGCGVRGAAL